MSWVEGISSLSASNQQEISNCTLDKDIQLYIQQGHCKICLRLGKSKGMNESKAHPKKDLQTRTRERSDADSGSSQKECWVQGHRTAEPPQ